MVSTRGHPTELPSPAIDTPSRARTATSPTSTVRSTANGTSKTPKATTTATTTSSTSVARRAKSPLARPTSPTSPSIALTRSTSSATRTTNKYTHAPSHLTLLWLAVSLPLVIWDTGYVLLRPHTMPGGKLHWPIWAPYKLYGEIDYVYGLPAYTARNGFTSAQGSLNVAETVMYLLYLYWVIAYGVEGGSGSRGRGAPKGKKVGLGWLSEARVIKGELAAWAALVLYTACVMTVSKTVLYALNETFSGFAGIGHNSWFRLIFLYILTNGAWVVVPSYIGYVAGAEIVAGLIGTSSSRSKKH